MERFRILYLWKTFSGAVGGVSTSHYIGMTPTSLHNRTLAHRSGHRRKDKGNALYQHDTEKHNSETQAYTARVISKAKDLLPLVMREAVLIEGQIKEVTINGKNEKGRALIRMVAARSEYG